MRRRKLKILILASLTAMPLFAAAQGISQLNQWTTTTTPSTAITQLNYGRTIKITGLSTGNCLTLDTNSLLTTTTCGSGLRQLLRLSLPLKRHDHAAYILWQRIDKRTDGDKLRMVYWSIYRKHYG